MEKTEKALGSGRIVELDDMLHGGFMEGDAVMLAGGAGCGKTTQALGSRRKITSEKFMDLFRGAAEKRK